MGRTRPGTFSGVRMKPTRLAILLALAAPLWGGAPWPKLPAEVWAMKEDPAKGMVGAVVLEDHLFVHNNATEYIYRVRIFSDKGRRAAQLPVFSKHVHSIEGHTIYPDGREVVFNQEKDFAKSELTTRSGFGTTRTMVIPPGVNGDCVVEVRWKESGKQIKYGPLKFGPLPPPTWTNKAWDLGNEFRTASTIFEISRENPFSWTLSAGASMAPKQSEKDGMQVLTWENLPPFEVPPYALGATLPRPRAFVFFQNDDLKTPARLGPDKYWSVVANSYIKWAFERNVTKGADFRALMAEGYSLFPADATPHLKATKLLELLHRKVKLIDQLTFQEQAERAPALREKPVEEESLGEILARGETTEQGMLAFFFTMAREAGLKPKLALMAKREQALFNYNATNFYQLSDGLVGIEDAAGTTWYDPGVRFGTPGVIRADFQGAPALMVDPKTWTPTQGALPIQPGAVNQQRYAYQIDVGEEEDLFQVKAAFSGIPEQAERFRYLRLEPKEQSKTLKESFERGLTGCAVTTAELSDVVQPAKPLSFMVKGRIERQGGRTRQVDPFPGKPLPLWIPDQLPDTRSLPIVLPYLSSHAAQSVIRVPQGFRFAGVQPVQNRNQFGTVSWSATPREKDGITEIECSYRVDVATAVAAPGAYRDFKTFLGWVSDVGRRTLVLEKVR